MYILLCCIHYLLLWMMLLPTLPVVGPVMLHYYQHLKVGCTSLLMARSASDIALYTIIIFRAFSRAPSSVPESARLMLCQSLFTSDKGLKGGGTCFRPRSFVCLSVCMSVCLCARLLKTACMDLDEMLRVDRCRDMDELINFLARSG